MNYVFVVTCHARLRSGYFQCEGTVEGLFQRLSAAKESIKGKNHEYANQLYKITRRKVK